MESRCECKSWTGLRPGLPGKPAQTHLRRPRNPTSTTAKHDHDNFIVSYSCVRAVSAVFQHWKGCKCCFYFFSFFWKDWFHLSPKVFSGISVHLFSFSTLLLCRWTCTSGQCPTEISKTFTSDVIFWQMVTYFALEYLSNIFDFKSFFWCRECTASSARAAVLLWVDNKLMYCILKDYTRKTYFFITEVVNTNLAFLCLPFLKSTLLGLHSWSSTWLNMRHMLQLPSWIEYNFMYCIIVFSNVKKKQWSQHFTAEQLLLHSALYCCLC